MVHKTHFTEFINEAEEVCMSACAFKIRQKQEVGHEECSAYGQKKF